MSILFVLSGGGKEPDEYEEATHVKKIRNTREFQNHDRMCCALPLTAFSRTTHQTLLH